METNNPDNKPSGISSPKPQHKSTLAEKFAWGAGGMTESLQNSIWTLSFPIYSIALGVSPALIGLAKAFPRVIDAFTDPIMGNISDNARTRFGRRRPFIFIGAILLALLAPLIFLPNPAWSELGLFAWFAGTAILFFLAFTIWSVPWSAMGLELTDDYNDRTRVQIARMVFATLANFATNWVYKITFFFDSDEVVGVRYVGFMIGGAMLVFGILSAFSIREWRSVSNQPSIKITQSIKTTLSNKPFLYLCGTVLFFAGGLVLVQPLLLYVNIYYVYDGDRNPASTVMGFSGTVGVFLALLMLPIGGWISEKIGKRNAAFIALSLIIVGKGSQYWLVIPEMPYLQLLTRAVYDPGIMLMWALIPSMIADVCDADELETGRRREASFSSVYQWIWKCGSTLAMVSGGMLIAMVGADVDGATDMLSDEVVHRLRLLLAIVPALFGCIAMVLIYKFPLTPTRVAQIKQAIEDKRANPTES